MYVHIHAYATPRPQYTAQHSTTQYPAQHGTIPSTSQHTHNAACNIKARHRISQRSTKQPSKSTAQHTHICGPLEQSPSGDSLRHSLTAALSSALEGNAVHTVSNIDPGEPSNMFLLLAFELIQLAPQSFWLNDVA